MLPDCIFVAGHKLAGKDFVCDRLVHSRGYTKLHIAEPWIRRHLRDMGVTWEAYTANKALYRGEIQRRGTLARQEDPDCLVKELPGTIYPLLDAGQKVVVSGIRFNNEARFAIDREWLVVKVVLPDSIRRDRFICAGEDLSKFNDPFEAEIDTLPFHFAIAGNTEYRLIVPTLETNWAFTRTLESAFGSRF